MSLASNAETARNFTTALRPSTVSLEFAIQTAINYPDLVHPCEGCGVRESAVLDGKTQLCVSCYSTCKECQRRNGHDLDCSLHPDREHECKHGVRWDCSPPCMDCSAEPWTGPSEVL